jgi:hypothetical protein
MAKTCFLTRILSVAIATQLIAVQALPAFASNPQPMTPERTLVRGLNSLAGKKLSDKARDAERFNIQVAYTQARAAYEAANPGAPNNEARFKDAVIVEHVVAEADAGQFVAGAKEVATIVEQTPAQALTQDQKNQIRSFYDKFDSSGHQYSNGDNCLPVVLIFGGIAGALFLGALALDSHAQQVSGVASDASSIGSNLLLYAAGATAVIGVIVWGFCASDS